MPSRQVIARLKREGWMLVHIRGSHHQYKHPNKPDRVTVPHPKKDPPKGTLRNIYRQAGWDWN
ncbi:MAG: type II toxin-antitoxin system HicA family toxin [Candidatus Poribacteria bacterium]|nr:type II toxin-antitoxin system HicA family toxin [Candidatus Poribacteria bacterium]